MWCTRTLIRVSIIYFVQYTTYYSERWLYNLVTTVLHGLFHTATARTPLGVCVWFVWCCCAVYEYIFCM